MNDLLVKPVDLMQLKSLLAHWLLIPFSDQPEPVIYRSGNTKSSLVAIDQTVLDKMVPDRTEQLEVLKAFLKHIETDSARLSELTDMNAIAQLAHRMKGASLMVGAQALVNAYAFIEREALSDKKTVSQDGFRQLDAALTQIAVYVHSLSHDDTGDTP
ncbi:MAG TPA: Hpt domain-containing protein, partial [Burkholderiales bacterium]|nr:Hpt domain-containing protein [Burkholderiales bacterium]